MYKLTQSCAVKANKTHLISTLVLQVLGGFNTPAKYCSCTAGISWDHHPISKKSMFETSNRFHWSISSFIPILLVHSSFTSRNYQQFANWKTTISKGKPPARKKTLATSSSAESLVSLCGQPSQKLLWVLCHSMSTTQSCD